MARPTAAAALIYLALAGCATTPGGVDGAADAGLTVPAAVVYFVDEERWELVTKQAEEYPDEIQFETVLADGSRVRGLLPPERIWEPPPGSVSWKTPSAAVLEDGRWVLRFVARKVRTYNLNQNSLETWSRRVEHPNDPSITPAFSVHIKHTTIPFD